MDKTEALTLFYQRNSIDISRASDKNDGNYDLRIASLSNQVDHWLSNMKEEDHDLFLALLSRFTYLTEAQCQLRYDRILTMLQQKLGRTEAYFYDILFVTVESGGPYKSGSDNVRVDLHKRNTERFYANQIIAAQSNFKKEELQYYNAVVFIDDIVGSSLTLWKEIKDFCDRFEIDGTGDHKLFYGCIAPRKRGMKHLRDKCKEYGIQAEPIFDEAWYVEPAFSKNSPAYLQIKGYEQLVGSYLMEPPESFFMGFMANRLLLAFHYNTPNNTLSTFWRDVPGQNVPPFRRHNQPHKRPSIDELKARRQEMCRNAYGFSQDLRRKIQNENA